jgi:hypothetical protein
MRSIAVYPLILLLFLTACTRRETPPPSALTVLEAMQAAMTDTAQTLPDGLIYHRGTPADGETPGVSHLTDTFLSALYGEAARGLLDGDGTGTAALGEAAIFLSVAPYPCELAVFRCSDLRSASTVAGLCYGRLDTVARGYRGSEWEAVAQKGKVSVDGCYVLLAVAEDPDEILARVKRLLP